MTNLRQVLVIDDEQERLDQLSDAVEQELAGVPVARWRPGGGEDPLARFGVLTETATGLIVTDHDLTKGGTGLLGSSITAWAQDRFIPVCNFSRQQQRKLPRESNFFELRVPAEPEEQARAQYIARIYRGFDAIRNHIAQLQGGATPTAAVLADAMGNPQLQDALVPYLTSVGSANSSFMRSLRESGEAPLGQIRVDFPSFILGHILINAVLEYPGPILSRRVLAAYCALGESAANDLATLFSRAEYNGPFSAPGEFFLRDAVDECIDALEHEHTSDPEHDHEAIEAEPAEVDQYNRAVVLQALRGDAQAHGCTRCHGTRGGLWCPFTKRAVCNREDCSVSSAAWIPRGATLCRVEHDYFEEWAPLLLSE